MTEQQPYELVRRYRDFELRRYPPHAVAEVVVNASFDRAGNAAFRHLFNYIKGNNTARQSLAMTAPVLQKGVARPETPSSQTVQMTAPVLQSRLADAALSSACGSDKGAYAVAFVLPAGMTEDSAPVPADPQVRIRTVPGSAAAVVRFPGSGSESAFAKHSRELLDALAKAGITPVGAPRFARFDPPFKPWFLRHNEVVQDVTPKQDEQ
jgi:hypothetical protein